MTPSEQPKREAPKPSLHAWQPSAWVTADAAAIQALVQGTATADQQQRALEWIVNTACGTYDMSFRPGAGDGNRETDFAEGKRFVGLQIVKLMKVDLAAARRIENGG